MPWRSTWGHVSGFEVRTNRHQPPPPSSTCFPLLLSHNWLNSSHSTPFKLCHSSPWSHSNPIPSLTVFHNSQMRTDSLKRVKLYRLGWKAFKNSKLPTYNQICHPLSSSSSPTDQPTYTKSFAWWEHRERPCRCGKWTCHASKQCQVQSLAPQVTSSGVEDDVTGVSGEPLPIWVDNPILGGPWFRRRQIHMFIYVTFL